MSKIYKLSLPKSRLQKRFFASVFAAALLTGIFGSSFAQIVKTESFDGVQFPPFGWVAGKISGSDPNNYTDRFTGPPVPQAGTGMCRYRCGSMFNAGEQYFMASPPYDLTNNPGTATVSFWMYKDVANPLNKDSLTLYINNVSAPGPSMVKVIGPITRDTTGFNGWKQYTAVLPAGFNTTQAYLVFVFTNRETSGAGPNLYVDNIQIQTYPKPAVFVSSAISYQETADVGKGLTDQLVIGIKIVVSGAGGLGNDSLRLDSIVTNANGSSNLLADVVNPSAKCWYTKGTNAFIMNGNQYGGTIPATFIRDKFTQLNFFLENGDNYFWITYSTRPAPFAISGDCIDADFLGAYYRWPVYIGADTSRGPTLSTMLGCRQIDVALCNGTIPTLSVGTSWLNGSYTNNDFVQRVFLGGARWFPAATPAYPWIDNNINAVNPFSLSYTLPFTVHPPDYEQLPVASASPTQPHTTAILVQGAMYPPPAILAGNPTNTGGIALQVGTWSSSNYITAWIDFNKDGDVLDAQEQLLPATSLNANQWITAGVNVPNVIGTPTPGAAGAAGIVYGNVKMRVREVFATSPIVACQSGYTFGEIEDYTVSIIPTCPALVKLWLGYTDDWGTPANWCGGVPTISDVALIDEVGYLGGTQIGAPFDPVIHSGTIATAKTIRLSSTDTLKINAPSASSLTVADSLSISYNGPGAKMIVNSAFSDTAQVSNGTNPTLVTPFMGNKRNGRMQIIFTKNDLLSKGLIAGDYIDQFLFHIRLRATPTPVVGYCGLTIKYATVDSTWAGWPVGPPTSLAPNTSPYVTLFTGPTASPGTVLPMAANTAGDLTINLTTRMYWNGVSNLVVEICYDNSIIANGSNVDQVCQTQVPTPGYNCTMWLNNNGSPNVAGCILNWPISGSTAAFGTQFRPNITFHYVRPYIKYPINITGNGGVTAGSWVNNGTFTAGYSNVTFNNNSQNQTIAGTSITTFNELTVNKTGGAGLNGVLMTRDVSVDTSLILTNGYLSLNQFTVNINYFLPMGITRTNGYILSETVSPTYSTVNWNIGTNTSLHTFPFGTASGYYIPVDFTKTVPATNVGIVSIATYKTAPNNTPWAAAGGPYTVTVNHMNSQSSGTDISLTDVIDRFWQVNKSVSGAITANMKFSYQPGASPAGEEPAGGPFTYVAQKYQKVGGLNMSPLGGWGNQPGTFVSGSISIALANDSIFGPWTLGNQSNPLPVQLINFDAKLVKDKVQIWWSTASEVDNDYFIVERSLDGKEFSFIDKIYSQGPSSKIQNYETYDMNPVEGLQYYRLKTVDVQGGAEYSVLRPVRYGKDGLFTIDYVIPKSTSNTIEVGFTYDSNESYTYSVVDILGRTLMAKTGNAGYEGTHKITIPVDMNHGIYFIMIENSQKKVATKFVY